MRPEALACSIYHDDMAESVLRRLQVEEDLRDALGRNEFELGGMIEASTHIFIDAVAANRGQFLFLAREQYGGSQAVRQALGELRKRITEDLSRDLQLMNRMPGLGKPSLDVLADLVIKAVFATLPELIDPPASDQPLHLRPEAKIIEQLRFIMIGGKHWRGLGKPDR